MPGLRTYQREFNNLYEEKIRQNDREALQATREAHLLGLNSGRVEIGLDPITSPNPRALQFAERNMSRAVRRIGQDTQRAITQAVKTGLKEGVRQDGIEDLIAANFSGESWRVPVIARTELNRAHNFGNLAAYQSSSVVKGKEWVTAGDDRVRPSHAVMDGETRRKGERFSIGVQAPPAGPNCRCSLSPITDLSEGVELFRLDRDEQATTEKTRGLVSLENQLIRSMEDTFEEGMREAQDLVRDLGLGARDRQRVIA